MSKELTPNTDGTIFDFLDGSHSYNGLWFGERPKGEGAFWWRKVLKEEIRKKERDAAGKGFSNGVAYAIESDTFPCLVEYLNEKYPL